MKLIISLLITLLSFSTFAADKTYKVEGMNCGSCISSLESKVCKMDGLKSCEISMGKLKITSKEGTEIDDKKVEALVAEAGHYKLVLPETKKTK